MNKFVIIGLTLLLSAFTFNYASRVTPTPFNPETKSKNQATPVVKATPTVLPTPTVKPTPTVEPSPTVKPTPTVEPTPTVQVTPVVQNDGITVRNLVLVFGKKLQMVSLSAHQSLVSQSIRENFGEFLSPALLSKWRKDPKSALGRTVSSPWPDRIDIINIEKTSPNAYQITGEIIEITSREKVNGGIAAKRPVILVVTKNDGEANQRFWIDEVMAGSYVAPRSLSYINAPYGFYFSLPESWKGYMIMMEQWEGLSISNGPAIGGSKVVESGPRISIRHPQWTAQEPRQDIPILVFTQTQWNALQRDKFHIGAAPIGPSELGRNNSYVFALPARYNYAFPTGFEEVQEILKGKPLQTFSDGVSK